MKFHIWNRDYYITDDGNRRKYKNHIEFNSDTPWILYTPEGKTIHEATHADAIKRMNIIMMGASK